MVGASATRTPSTVEAMMATCIARSRPTRSATQDHGRTASATPRVASETDRAASAGLTRSPRARVGSSPCGE